MGYRIQVGQEIPDSTRRLYLFIDGRRWPLGAQSLRESDSESATYAWSYTSRRLPFYEAGETHTLNLRYRSEAPRKLGAQSNANSTGIRLSWKPPLSDGGSSVSKHQYQVLAAEDYSSGIWGPWKDIPASGAGGTNSTSYTVPNLTLGKEYAFQVRGVTAAGPSSSSNVAVAIAGEVPAPPTLTIEKISGKDSVVAGDGGTAEFRIRATGADYLWHPPPPPELSTLSEASIEHALRFQKNAGGLTARFEYEWVMGSTTQGRSPGRPLPRKLACSRVTRRPTPTATGIGTCRWVSAAKRLATVR